MLLVVEFVGSFGMACLILNLWRISIDQNKRTMLPKNHSCISGPSPDNLSIHMILMLQVISLYSIVSWSIELVSFPHPHIVDVDGHQSKIICNGLPYFNTGFTRVMTSQWISSRCEFVRFHFQIYHFSNCLLTSINNNCLCSTQFVSASINISVAINIDKWSPWILADIKLSKQSI